jgi:hypothetical protein
MFQTHKSTRFRFWFSILALCLCHARAWADDAVKELQIRAAYVLNFVKFTTWPEDAFDGDDDPLILAVLGTDPFGPVLEQTFHKQRIHDRPVELKRISIPSRADYKSIDAYESAFNHAMKEADTCQVLYLNTMDAERVIEALDSRMTLVVGHERSMAEHGAHLALDRSGSNIIFYANLKAIHETRLDVSSKLLKLARMIDEKPSGGTK